MVASFVDLFILTQKVQNDEQSFNTVLAFFKGQGFTVTTEYIKQRFQVLLFPKDKRQSLPATQQINATSLKQTNKTNNHPNKK